MLHKIYRSLMQVSAPVLEAVLERRAQKGKEDSGRMHERRGAPVLARKAGPLLWFHAASVGESLSLLSVIERILKDYPAAQAMVTTGTVTSARLMAERLPDRAFHQYVPMDHPLWVQDFLDHWRPDLVLWSESELWPNMLEEVRNRNIPAVLLNARMSEQSFARWRWARGMVANIFSTFSLCLAQDVVEAERLHALGAARVLVTSNIKYAAPPLPFDTQALAKLQEAVAGRPLVLWASTHPGEEELAAELHIRLRRQFSRVLSLVVPRHPVRGKDIAAIFLARDLNVAQRSAGQMPGTPTDIYLADTLGELGVFYRLCRLAILGGSFADVGGHNPIEPGQLGCVILYGPMMYNFRTINADFLSAGAALQVGGIDDLFEKVSEDLFRPENTEGVLKAAQKLTAEKSNAMEKVMGHLQPYLAALAGKMP